MLSFHIVCFGCWRQRPAASGRCVSIWLLAATLFEGIIVLIFPYIVHLHLDYGDAKYILTIQIQNSNTMYGVFSQEEREFQVEFLGIIYSAFYAQNNQSKPFIRKQCF